MPTALLKYLFLKYYFSCCVIWCLQLDDKTCRPTDLYLHYLGLLYRPFAV